MDQKNLLEKQKKEKEKKFYCYNHPKYIYRTLFKDNGKMFCGHDECLEILKNL